MLQLGDQRVPIRFDSNVPNGQLFVVEGAHVGEPEVLASPALRREFYDLAHGGDRRFTPVSTTREGYVFDGQLGQFIRSAEQEMERRRNRLGTEIARAMDRLEGPVDFLPQSAGVALFESDALPTPRVGSYFTPRIERVLVDRGDFFHQEYPALPDDFFRRDVAREIAGVAHAYAHTDELRENALDAMRYALTSPDRPNVRDDSEALDTRSPEASEPPTTPPKERPR